MFPANELILINVKAEGENVLARQNIHRSQLIVATTERASHPSHFFHPREID